MRRDDTVAGGAQPPSDFPKSARLPPGERVASAARRWNSGCIGGRMLPPRLVTPALLASLALACTNTRPPVAAARAVEARPDAGYVTIVPHVTVSRNADETQQPRAALDPSADVMAEILAIPPGG